MGVSTAVCVGIPDEVPDSITNIINIGNRCLDVKTLIAIARKLDMAHLLEEKKFVDHFESLKKLMTGISGLLGKANNLENQLQSLLNIMEDGIILIDESGYIQSCNMKGVEIIGCDDSVLNRNINDILPDFPKPL